MPRSPRMTLATGTVLESIAAGYRYGFDIMDASGLPDGTVYPALRRLEAGGLVRAEWEDAGLARREGRPPRRYYDLTDGGNAALAEARERFPMLGHARTSRQDAGEEAAG